MSPPDVRSPAAPIRHVEHVMGTVVSFDIRPDDDQAAARRALTDALRWLQWVDTTFSTYRADSEISRLNRGELRLGECAPEVAQVLDLCTEFQAQTGGYFSARYAGGLDPTGLVKGWSIEKAAELLRAAGVRRYCVNGGGDVQAAGEPEPGRAWRVGIADPLRPGIIAAVVEIRDGAVATSGTAERGLHVLDPFSGRPATTWASLTVVGEQLTFVDAYATAALAMGERAASWLESTPGVAAFGVRADGGRWQTRNFYASTREIPTPP